MASHTTTGEWKSFELRMRHRRAERLLLRAGTAAEAGRVEEARDCIEEARHLAPSLSGIASIEQKLAEPAPPPLLARGPLSRVLVAAGVAIAAGLGMLVAAWRTPAPTLSTARDLSGVALSVPVETETAPSPPTAPAPTPEASRQPDETRLPIDAAADHALPPDNALPLVETAPPIMPRRETPAPPPSKPPEAVPASLELPAHTGVEPPGPAARIAAPAVIPSPEAPSAFAPAPAATPTVGTATIPPSTIAPSTSAPSSPVVARADDRSAVRGVLDRYAAAYSDLDAAAAQQVWPGVDQATLARAFDSLASQRVTLANCRIDVSGETARASCIGSATWAPKVGDTAPRTDPRAWSFDLSRAGGDWRIVNARVQNR